MSEPVLALVASPSPQPSPARGEGAAAEGGPVRLNLGAGGSPIEGYDNTWDLGQGKRAYPLDVPDASCDEIRASHVFEHFSHKIGPKVLADWVRALKPGGLLKLAVPDFEYIAHGFLEGRGEPWQAYLCGSQENDADVHLAQYNGAGLGQLMRDAGLVGVHKWKGEGDCSALPVSLNLAAWKPPAVWPKLVGVMSVPRLGFMDNFFCAAELMAKLRIPYRKTTGAYWGQCMTRSIEQALEEGAEWVLTIDYDTVYMTEAVLALLAIAVAHPDADAIVPIQMGRNGKTPLATFLGPDGKVMAGVDRAHLDATLVPIGSGHFGCTLLRARAFEKMARPWFIGKPDAEGRWGDERIDDDIHFWNVWRQAGNTLYCAPRCVVGHGEFNIRWPDENLQPLLQNPAEFWTDGEPRGVWR